MMTLRGKEFEMSAGFVTSFFTVVLCDETALMQDTVSKESASAGNKSFIKYSSFKLFS